MTNPSSESFQQLRLVLEQAAADRNDPQGAALHALQGVLHFLGANLSDADARRLCLPIDRLAASLFDLVSGSNPEFFKAARNSGRPSVGSKGVVKGAAAHLVALARAAPVSPKIRTEEASKLVAAALRRHNVTYDGQKIDSTQVQSWHNKMLSEGKGVERDIFDDLERRRAACPLPTSKVTLKNHLELIASELAAMPFR